MNNGTYYWENKGFYWRTEFQYKNVSIWAEVSTDLVENMMQAFTLYEKVVANGMPESLRGFKDHCSFAAEISEKRLAVDCFRNIETRTCGVRIRAQNSKTPA